MNKKVHIIGGGTISYIKSHLALSAPAYGTTAKQLAGMCHAQNGNLDIELHLTKMADSKSLIETNIDVEKLIDRLIEEESTKIIFFNPAIVDFQAVNLSSKNYEITQTFEKHGQRLSSTQGEHVLSLQPTDKIVGKIRKSRKDIFLVAFKTTTGATEQEQYLAGLNLLKSASCNLVLANDVVTRRNMIITPEEARYHTTMDRAVALQNLVNMAYLRSHLTFTRSTVVAGDPVAWNDARIPTSLRTVVDYCIKNNAYKPFRGSTVGHFAVKLDETTFLTSRRKTNFNDLNKLGLVLVKTDGPDSIIAYGSRPSVGGQSQRIVFSDHPGYDCIVHFHCPKNESSDVPSVSQREFECGSHECGKNTSNGLKKFGNLKAVFLDEHGPNIIFHHSIDPNEVIAFICKHFKLESKTGGYVS